MVGEEFENYCQLQPSPTYYEPLHLARRDRLEFKYRVVVHRGHVNPDLVKAIIDS